MEVVVQRDEVIDVGGGLLPGDVVTQQHCLICGQAGGHLRAHPGLHGEAHEDALPHEIEGDARDARRALRLDAYHEHLLKPPDRLVDGRLRDAQALRDASLVQTRARQDDEHHDVVVEQARHVVGARLPFLARKDPHPHQGPVPVGDLEELPLRLVWLAKLGHLPTPSVR